jgi:hypothetical protein
MPNRRKRWRVCCASTPNCCWTVEPPGQRPGLDPERAAFIQQHIAELEAHLAKGGLREAAIRSLVYIGLAGPGVDERAFNQLRRIREEHTDKSLSEFKQLLREQFFALMLNWDGALAAIPQMLPDGAHARLAVRAENRQVVLALMELTGERADRMGRIERLFHVGKLVQRVADATGGST